MAEPEYITLGEAMALARVCSETIHRWPKVAFVERMPK